MNARNFGVAAALHSQAPQPMSPANTGSRILALVPGATASYASGINASGQVVGSFNLSNGGGGGFLYSSGTRKS